MESGPGRTPRRGLACVEKPGRSLKLGSPTGCVREDFWHRHSDNSDGSRCMVRGWSAEQNVRLGMLRAVPIITVTDLRAARPHTAAVGGRRADGPRMDRDPGHLAIRSVQPDDP